MDAGFRRFWLGETVTFFGGAVRSLALPLTAVVVLEATPTQMGLLVMLQTLPTLFVSLFAGVWVDRVRRRPIMVGGSLVRAALLIAIPVLATTGSLRMGHLYVVSVGLGSVSIISMIAARAYLAWLVPPEKLVRANSRLELSGSAAHLAGPGLGGVLIAAVTAPVALALDAVAHLIGAACLASIPRREDPPAPREQRKVFADIREGLRLVLHHAILRPIVLCGASHNFASQMIVALSVLYMTRVLGINAWTLGLIIGAAGPGALLGAAIAPRLADRWGMGRALLFSQVLTGVARVMIPLAAGPKPLVIAILVASELLLGIARPIFNVNQISLRQRSAPGHLQGRINASFSFLLWGLPPLGAAFGGWLASRIGMRPVLLIASGGVFAAALWVLFSKLVRQPAGLNGEEHPS